MSKRSVADLLICYFVSAVNHQDSKRNVRLPMEGMLQSEASLDQWLPTSNSPASLRTTAPSSLTSHWEKSSPSAVSSGPSERKQDSRRAVDGSNEHAGDVATSGGSPEADDSGPATQMLVCRADSNTDISLQGEFKVDDGRTGNPVCAGNIVCEGRLRIQNSVSSGLSPARQKDHRKGTSMPQSGLPVATCIRTSFELGGLEVSRTPLQLLESKLDDQIHYALQKLRETQAAEYKCAEAQLLVRKLHLTKVAQVVDQERRERSVESSGDDVGVCGQLQELQEAVEEFDIMLKVSDGFSSIPKDSLRNLFGWPPLDQHL